ncbi:MAG TPA: NUDIX domain-containing protein [archaeon]|nr:NUDIX domain-containing protein [archaeon]
MEELIDVVNKNNVVIGSATMKEVYEKKLNHRIVHVLIFNAKDEIFLQKQSMKKRFCPGYWTTSAGGHVQKDESYKHAAKRELKEEIGIDVSLKLILETTFDVYGMIKFLNVFKGFSQGPFKFNEEEVMDGKWFSLAEIKGIIKENKVIHPELAHIINKLSSVL